MQYLGWITILVASLDIKVCPLGKETELRKQINHNIFNSKATKIVLLQGINECWPIGMYF